MRGIDKTAKTTYKYKHVHIDKLELTQKPIHTLDPLQVDLTKAFSEIATMPFVGNKNVFDHFTMDNTNFCKSNNEYFNLFSMHKQKLTAELHLVSILCELHVVSSLNIALDVYKSLSLLLLRSLMSVNGSCHLMKKTKANKIMAWKRADYLLGRLCRKVRTGIFFSVIFSIIFTNL